MIGCRNRQSPILKKEPGATKSERLMITLIFTHFKRSFHSIAVQLILLTLSVTLMVRVGFSKLKRFDVTLKTAVPGETSSKR